MNKIQTYISTFIAVSGICFTSCTNDNNIDWNGVEVTNTELRTILQQKDIPLMQKANWYRMIK